ncbi:HNH endonuclease family protein [Thiothrix lacustris]|uniref:HNH endonuclease family protein n=1 Tax=Thiothrix lacustris TaxID=525917 RepID=A0ABY9MV80_9GAMM|nr:HNH endonuclease family protein [Thiothrix lacustris]WML92448.1 HNH endonuclease family protein [Thiothrix lacustris]
MEFNNKFGSKRLENTTDHITPITPNFTTYTQDFINVCLNNIGNLTLMVWGSNSEKKNNDPVEKINLFDSDFYSHKEIRDTLIARKIWGEQEIKERQARICKFIAQHWNLV